MTRDPVFRVTLALWALVILVAGTLRVVPAATVERVYSRGVFPWIGQGLGVVTGAVEFSVTEPLFVAAAIGVLVGIVRFGRQKRFLIGLVGAAGAVWLLFQAVWGVNYRREPIAAAFGLTVRPSGVEDIRGLAETLAQQIAVVPPPGPDDLSGWLAAGPAIYRSAAAEHPLLAGTYAIPKPLLGSELLSWMGLLGFYDPFTAEANLNVRAPSFVIPFVVLHEMAHQRGVASEDEASFLGYLLGRDHGDEAFRYSALWEGVIHVWAAYRTADPDGAEAWWARLPERVREDARTYAAWRADHASPLGTFAHAVNDTYLRSQGVRDGVASYGRVTDLMLAEWRAR